MKQEYVIPYSEDGRNRRKAGRFRGHGFLKERWHSICSRCCPPALTPECHLCQKGSWHNVWANRMEGLVEKFAYPLWFWWANRPKKKAKFVKQMQEWGFKNFR